MTAKTSIVPRGTGFKDALTLLAQRREDTQLSTGSPSLDRLIGGIKPGWFYLFYGPEKEGAPDRVLHRLLVNALKPRPRGGKAVYLLCGNYRHSRTLLDTELLLELLEAEQLPVAEALTRVTVVCAFSRRQQVQAADHVENTLRSGKGFSLVAVQQIAKLFEDHNLRGLVETVSKLRRLCYRERVSLVATCRASGEGEPIPLPEGGVFMRHAASVIVYLRTPRGGGVSAYLVKHPDRARVGPR